jgi:hypothetical protein
MSDVMLHASATWLRDVFFCGSYGGCVNFGIAIMKTNTINSYGTFFMLMNNVQCMDVASQILYS